jgi:outer membrane receptor protein involved in Fe transport
MAPTGCVGAESSMSEFTMETIWVTDSRIETEKESETNRATTINVKDKIDAGQIKSITDLLQDVPGVIVNTSPQSGTSVSMRGMSNERILIAINGNVIENQGGIHRGRGLEWDSLPVSNVKKIEIIRGASSAQYGGTWGGIINIVTLDKPGENKTFLKYSYGSWNDQKTSVTNQGNTANNRLSWIINANKRKSDGFYRNNYLDSQDVNLNLAYRFSDKARLTFAFTDSDRKEGVITGNNHLASNVNGWDDRYPEVPAAPGASTGANSQYLDGSYRHFKTKNYSLNFDYENWQARVYKNTQNRVDYLRYRNSNATSEINTDNSGYSLQQNLKLKQHNLIYGLDYRQLELSGSNNFKADMQGYFVQDTWQAAPKVLIGLGVRYDIYNARDTAKDNTLSDESQVSPKASVTYKLGKNEAVYASASRVFRPATVADYSRWSGNYSGTNQNRTLYNNAHGLNWSLSQWQQVLGLLKPERGMAYELGWKKGLSDRWNLKITGFYNDIDDYVNVYSGSEISSQPPTYNIANAKIKGIELATDYQFSKMLGGVISYTTQSSSKSGDQLDPDGTEVTTLPRNTFNLGLRYNNLKGLRSSLDARFRDDQRFGKYTIVDWALSYTKGIHTISLAINNLFDTQYQQTAGFPMPGTNYNVSYQIAF